MVYFCFHGLNVSGFDNFSSGQLNMILKGHPVFWVRIHVNIVSRYECVKHCYKTSLILLFPPLQNFCNSSFHVYHFLYIYIYIYHWKNESGVYHFLYYKTEKQISRVVKFRTMSLKVICSNCRNNISQR